MSGTILFFLLCSSVLKISETPVYRTNLFNMVGHQRGFQSVSLIEASEPKERMERKQDQEKRKKKYNNNSAAYGGYTEQMTRGSLTTGLSHNLSIESVTGHWCHQLCSSQRKHTNTLSVDRVTKTQKHTIRPADFFNANFFQNASMIRDDHISQIKMHREKKN